MIRGVGVGVDGGSWVGVVVWLSRGELDREISSIRVATDRIRRSRST